MTHVVNTKLIKGFGDFNLLLGIKKGIGELFTLSQCALYNLKTGDIAQEIGDAGVVAVGIPRGCGVRVLTSLDGGEAIVVHCVERRISSIELKQDLILNTEINTVPFPLASVVPLPLVCPLAVLSAPGHILSAGMYGVWF